jgi:hypothetical protein
MSNEQQFLIIVRFPAWEQEFDGKVQKYSPYGMKFLFTMPNIQYPDWPDDDKRWHDWDERKITRDAFAAEFKKSRGKKFEGEVLFIEPVSISELKSSELTE